MKRSSQKIAGSRRGGAIVESVVRAFVFVARTTQHVLPSSARVELCIYTIFTLFTVKELCFFFYRLHFTATQQLVGLRVEK